MSLKYSVLYMALVMVCNNLYAADTVLNEVVVSGSRSATSLSQTPQSIGAVKQQELQRDKSKTVGEMINRIPGVSWNDLGNEQHSMGIRQPISTNAVYQYLEDGIPIRPLGVFNHNSLNEMNMAATDSVEVVKGAASSLYGSNAVGGAVNFLSAAPSRVPYFSAGVRYDQTDGFTRYDTAASNTFDKLGVHFAHYSSRRDSNNWQQYSGGSKDSISIRADYALNEDAKLRASLIHTDLDTETSGSLFENDYYNNPGKSINTFTYRKDVTTRANLAWEGELIKNGYTTATLFSRKNDHGQLPNYTITGCAAGVCRGTINNNHVESLGVDLKHEHSFDWLNSRLIAGVYWDSSENPYVSDNLRIVQDPNSGKYLSYTLNNSANPNGVRNYQADILNQAVFAQWEASPSDKMRLVLGGRSDQIRYDFTNNLTPSANYGAPNESRSFSHFSPKIGATYMVNSQANVYANISEGFTPPEVSQLYSKTAIPNLNPATYDNYEVGLRMAFWGGALKLDSAIYRLDGRDTIVSYTIAQGNSENRNAGKTRSQGVELGLNYSTGNIDARLSTSLTSHRYQQYQVAANQNYSGKFMPQAPSHVTSAEIGYKPIDTARIALSLVKQGAYWMNNANTVEYGGHTLFNLNGSYQFAQGWEGWLQVRNLTDQHYADSASSSYSGAGVYAPNSQNAYTLGAPRSVMLGASYRFVGK